MRRLTVLLLVLLGFGTAGAQQEGGSRPEWADGYFRELSNSYIEVVSANGTDRALARDRAARLVVERRNMASGGEYNVHVNGQTVVVTGNGSLTVKSRVLDEYAEHRGDGDWMVYLLVQTAKNPTYDYESVSVSDRYPLSYKTFIPGMSQIDKGQTTKGLIIIGAEVAMVGGIVAFEGLRSSYDSKISTTHNAKQKADYIDRTDTYATLRNICIAGAAAVYVWNIVDAIVSKGPRRVHLGDASIQTAPFVSPDGVGLAMNIRF